MSIAYDRDTLLFIRGQMDDGSADGLYSKGVYHSSPLLLPLDLCHLLRGVRHVCRRKQRRKRRRKRGKRGGVKIQLRNRLVWKQVALREQEKSYTTEKCYTQYGYFLQRRSLEKRYVWLQPVFPALPLASYTEFPWFRTGGVNFDNLRAIPCLPNIKTGYCLTTKMALFNTRSLSNKALVLRDLVTTNNLDFLFLVETWLKPGENWHLNEACPQSYSFFNYPRLSGRGGGLAAIFKDSYRCTSVSLEKFTSFEVLAFKITGEIPVFCAVVYRPPNSQGGFMMDFSNFVSSLLLDYDKILLVGDFNFHIDVVSNRDALDFMSRMESFNFTQHVVGPTHNRGHTLDLVFTLGLCPSSTSVEELFLSDHKCISFTVPLYFKDDKPRRIIKSRILNNDSVVKFSDAFTVLGKQLLQSTNTDANNLTNCFNKLCLKVLEEVAPIKTRSKPIVNCTPWITEDIISQKRKCRRAEREWKKTQLQVHFLYLKDLWANFNTMVKEARVSYFKNLISMHSHNPRFLFSTIDTLVNGKSQSASTLSIDSEIFLKFFGDKIVTLRANIDIPHTYAEIKPPCGLKNTLDTFSPISLNELKEIVHSLHSSSSPDDILPARFLKSVFESIGTHLLSIVNLSLKSGCVPDCLKMATVQPILKKPGLDSEECANYRPISKLPFISKILEKVVAKQLLEFLEENRIFEKFQSGFRQRHSTETALLKVLNDILMNADAGEVSILVLLDISAAFDTIDHGILLNRLHQWVGLSGTPLKWFSSYLCNRKFSVVMGGKMSSRADLVHGVPQGSILGPILFLLYMLPLGKLISRFNISYHFFADDTQLYLSVKRNDSSKLKLLTDCLEAIKEWMSCNYLHLNEGKTEVLILGDDNTTVNLNDLGCLALRINPYPRNLGVIFDRNLTFSKHIKRLVQSSYLQLRNISKIRHILSFKDLERIIHVFISSRLDYCNGLFTCLNQGTMAQLQLVQNSAARLLTRTKKREHITPVLASLHWLPIKFRVDFKLLVLTFQALKGDAPEYLTDLLVPYSNSRTLRSSGQGLLVVPRTKRKRKGDCAFAVRAPLLWNNLPLEIRLVESLSLFKKRLKTHLYTLAFEGVC